MVTTGACPKCERKVSHANLDQITLGDKITGPLHRGVSMICPNCKTVLGVAFDPIALKADIVDEVLEGLGHKRRKR